MVLHHIDQDDQVTPGEVDISGLGLTAPLRLTEERLLPSEALFSGLDHLPHLYSRPGIAQQQIRCVRCGMALHGSPTGHSFSIPCYRPGAGI